MKETTLKNWTELSLATKTLLQEKHPLKLIQSPKVIDLLARVSQLISKQKIHNTLLLTLNISDAIFIKMLLSQANPKLKSHLILADTPSTQIHYNQAEITIIPYPLFSLEHIRQHPLPLLDLNLIMIDEAIPAHFLHDLLFIDELNRSLLTIENETLLLSADFTEVTKILTDRSQAHQDHLHEHTLPPSQITSPKITLKRTKIEKIKEIEEPDLKSLETINPDSTATDRMTTDHPHHEAPFIALVPKNLQRQYVRDYIRTHQLQHLLIVTHNRQAARLLEKYLYRARIRSRVVHEKINEETANSLFERYNKGQFTALILMHQVIEEFASHIKECDSVMFLDFPTVYSEFAEKFQFIQNHYKPAHLIAIATENDKVWIQSFAEEHPQLGLPLIPVDITPPKQRESKANTAKKENKKLRRTTKASYPSDTTTLTTHDTQDHNSKIATQNLPTEGNEQRVDADNSLEYQGDSISTDVNLEPEKQIKERSSKNRKTTKRGRSSQAQNQNDKIEEKQKNNRRSATKRTPRGQTRTNHRYDRRNKNYNNNQESRDSQSDFFNINQDEIVNRNRLPFESGSFEANIARENRRRNRDPFGIPGGIGQSSNGNFIQNLTQGYGNSNDGINGNSLDNNRRTQRRPRTKNNRKK